MTNNSKDDIISIVKGKQHNKREVKIMFNFFRNIFRNNNNTIITVIARELDTDTIETFRFDSIAYGNWMMANDVIQDYEIIEIIKNNG